MRELLIMTGFYWEGYTKSIRETINKCPICEKSVTYSEQNRFSFAGRCCKDCLPKMQKKYEKPGWYN